MIVDVIKLGFFICEDVNMAECGEEHPNFRGSNIFFCFADNRMGRRCRYFDEW